jgi:hypothetical protein
MSAAIYFSCGALVAAALSVAIWVSHRNFLRTVGRLPPKVIYGYDYRGELDKTVVVWTAGYWKIYGG